MFRLRTIKFPLLPGPLLLVPGICLLGFSSPVKNHFQPKNIEITRISGLKDSLAKPISTSLPFSKVGNLIIVKAVVDSVQGNFILDTGAPGLILNLVYFRDYPVTIIADEQPTGMSSGATQVNRTSVKTFSLGDLNYMGWDADLVDLGHIENSKGIRILGLIGFDLLKQCEMVIDYEKSLIHIQKIGKHEKKNYKSRHLEEDPYYISLPITIKDNKIITETQMKGKKYHFVLDSGAETNIIDSRLPDKFLEEVNITGRLNIRGTGNSTVEALKGDLSQLKLGEESLENLPVLVANLERTCFSLNGCANGVLGFDFMPLKKLGFNFITRKMYLWK